MNEALGIEAVGKTYHDGDRAVVVLDGALFGRTGRRLGDLTEQTPADHHVVRGSRVDSDPDRFGRTGCRCGFCRGSFWRGSFCHGVFLSGRRWSASAVTTASAISAALPAPASTVIVARPV